MPPDEGFRSCARATFIYYLPRSRQKHTHPDTSKNNHSNARSRNRILFLDYCEDREDGTRFARVPQTRVGPLKSSSNSFLSVPVTALSVVFLFRISRRLIVIIIRPSSPFKQFHRRTQSAFRDILQRSFGSSGATFPSDAVLWPFSFSRNIPFLLSSAHVHAIVEYYILVRPLFFRSEQL